MTDPSPARAKQKENNKIDFRKDAIHIWILRYMDFRGNAVTF